MDDSKETRYLTVVFCLRLLWDSIYESWTKAAADQGLTVTEEMVLWAVWLSDSSTVSDVASRLQRDKGTISKCIYSLEENGLIIRKAGSDRRSFTFELSEEGHKIRKSLGGAHRLHSVFLTAFRSLPDGEQKTLFDLLLKLVSKLEGEDYVSKMTKSLTLIDEVLKQ
ncbi:MAG: MarR family winged helix-turn-helix transcriptional regulator [Candidatus Wallacebacter cryptica]|jgi:DNA-binding MarR family transcriptional regulator|nr:winged helix DNA-binding protein [Bacillota bacterium]